VRCLSSHPPNPLLPPPSPPQQQTHTHNRPTQPAGTQPPPNARSSIFTQRLATATATPPTERPPRLPRVTITHPDDIRAALDEEEDDAIAADAATAPRSSPYLLERARACLELAVLRLPPSLFERLAGMLDPGPWWNKQFSAEEPELLTPAPLLPPAPSVLRLKREEGDGGGGGGEGGSAGKGKRPYVMTPEEVAAKHELLEKMARAEQAYEKRMREEAAEEEEGKGKGGKKEGGKEGEMMMQKRPVGKWWGAASAASAASAVSTAKFGKDWRKDFVAMECD
jgi:hypothetical protein